MICERTQVAIIGAGPAGLLLGQLLARAGIDSVILEARSREYVQARIRAGVLEPGTIDALRQAGVAERMDREGLRHDGIYLCFDKALHHIPISELTGGRAMMIYGQAEIVKDLIAARLETEAPLLFECSEVSLAGIGDDAPVVTYQHRGQQHQLRADFVAGCDGFHGVCRDAIPARELTISRREYPYAWLGILVDAAPSTDQLIYAHSEHGFALHSMRSEASSRLYIQISPNEKLADWPDDRIWSELHRRLAHGGRHLNEGPVIEKSITPMRSFVAAPMRHGSLLLAGDAAHIVPPTGAKGLNLAVADVTVLAQALIEQLRHRSGSGLAQYSDRCLSRVWRAQHFSWSMTTMLHLDPTLDDYGQCLQRAQLRYVTSSTAASTTLAENYVGLPPQRPIGPTPG